MDIHYELYKVFLPRSNYTPSFSEAANKLFISQSAVSQSIKALEKKLNQSFYQEYQKGTPDTGRRTAFRHVEPAMNLIFTVEKSSFRSF